MNRRTLLTSAAAAGGALAFSRVRAQPPAPASAEKGPAVWLGLDQQGAR